MHNALLIFIKLLGLFIKTELCTSDGRIDLFIRTEKFYYIIEVKLNDSAQEAIDQINDKAYTLPFACDRRKIFKIGISFSSNHRRLHRMDCGERQHPLIHTVFQMAKSQKSFVKNMGDYLGNRNFVVRFAADWVSAGCGETHVLQFFV